MPAPVATVVVADPRLAGRFRPRRADPERQQDDGQSRQRSEHGGLLLGAVRLGAATALSMIGDGAPLDLTPSPSAPPLSSNPGGVRGPTLGVTDSWAGANRSDAESARRVRIPHRAGTHSPVRAEMKLTCRLAMVRPEMAVSRVGPSTCAAGTEKDGEPESAWRVKVYILSPGPEEQGA